MARSSATVVNDLHELLQRTPVTGPFVLVGHCIGGEYVRIFAAKYPSELAGLVLVDSTHPDQRQPPVMLSPINRIPVFARRFLCYALPLMGRFGVIRLLMPNAAVYVPPQFNSEQRAEPGLYAISESKHLRWKPLKNVRQLPAVPFGLTGAAAIRRLMGLPGALAN